MKRNSALRVLAVAIVVGIILMALVACGNSVRSGNKEVGDCTTGGGTNCVTTINYKGKPLHCITWQGYGTEVGLSCDFVEYHLNELTKTETPEGF